MQSEYYELIFKTNSSFSFTFSQFHIVTRMMLWKLKYREIFDSYINHDNLLGK